MGSVVLYFLPVPWFNLIKCSLASLLLAWLFSVVSCSMERLRRAYFLATQGKVRIGGPTNSVVRWLGITTSPFSCGLQVICLLLRFAVELSAETNGTDTVFVGVPHSEKVRLRPINKTFDPVRSKSEYATFKKGFVHCAFQNLTHILVWPTEILEVWESPKLNCPRNVTTQYLADNEVLSKIMELADLKRESILVADAFGPSGKIKWYSPELPFVVVLNLADFDQIERRLSSQEFIDSSNDESRWLVEYESNSTEMKLTCVKKRTAEQEIGEFLACVSRTSDGRGVLFQELDFRSELEKGTVNLAPAAFVRGLEEATVVDLMQKAFVEPNYSLRRWPILIGAIMAKMAEDGLLHEVLQMDDVIRNVHVNGKTRPVVKVWVLVIVPLLLVLLFGISVGTNRLASRIFPYGGLVGEDNMIRIWSGEKHRELRSDTREPSWLALEDSGSGKRLTANVDEPGSILYDKKIHIRGVL